MEMSKNDWRAYAQYLQSQLPSKERLKNPASIGESYNNHMLSQDLDDVNNNKIYVKAKA